MQGYRDELIKKGWTPAQADMALEFLESQKDECECMDNFRFARDNNAEERSEYYDLKDSGCCGSTDKVFETPDGAIMVGFNYGH